MGCQASPRRVAGSMPGNCANQHSHANLNAAMSSSLALGIRTWGPTRSSAGHPAGPRMTPVRICEVRSAVLTSPVRRAGPARSSAGTPERRSAGLPATRRRRAQSVRRSCRTVSPPESCDLVWPEWAIGSRGEKHAANPRFPRRAATAMLPVSRRVGNATSAVDSARIRGRT